MSKEIDIRHRDKWGFFTLPLYNVTLEKEELPPGTEVGIRLTRGFKYRLGKHKFNVEKHTVSNFASFPRIIRMLGFRPNDPRWDQASVFHDDLYAENALPRLVCDALFYCACRAQGTPRWIAALFFVGLVIGGGPAYRRCKKVNNKQKGSRDVPVPVMDSEA